VHIAAEGDIVFVHWRATGTHVGQHQLYEHVREVEPTGEEGTVSGITLYRIEGGKFVEEWNYHTVLEYGLEHGLAGDTRRQRERSGPGCGGSSDRQRHRQQRQPSESDVVHDHIRLG
jgi:hypothetical protein